MILNRRVTKVTKGPMVDIVDQLREVKSKDFHPDSLRTMVLWGADEIERLRKIERAAQALKFSAYPAHGSGFVITVTGGNIDDLKAALAGTR